VRYVGEGYREEGIHGNTRVRDTGRDGGYSEIPGREYQGEGDTDTWVRDTGRGRDTVRYPGEGYSERERYSEIPGRENQGEGIQIPG